MSTPYDDLKTPEGVKRWVVSAICVLRTMKGDTSIVFGLPGYEEQDEEIAAYIAEQLSRIDALQAESTRLVLENRALKDRLEFVVKLLDAVEHLGNK